jgi:predicted permease
MPSFVLELRYALRRLRRRPGFALVVVGTVGIGIGAASAVFSVINAFVLRPLRGVADQRRLVNVHKTAPGDQGSTELLSFSHPHYRELREASPALSGVAAFRDVGVSLATGGPGSEAQLVVGQVVSGNYFEVLGTRPVLGRFFLPEEDRAPGAHPVVVLGHGLWQRRFAGDPQAVGRSVRINGQPFTVVGVAPPGFVGHFHGFAFDLFLPLMMAEQVMPAERLEARGGEFLELVARLAPGAGRERAAAELDALAARWASEDAAHWPAGTGFEVRPTTGLEDSLRGGILGFFGLLAALAGLVLLIVCVNVGGMLLAEGSARAREVAIRSALGAGRTRLVRQLLGEAVVLFAAGGALGLGLAVVLTRGLAAFEPPMRVPLAIEVAPDARVASFALLLALLSAVVFGLLPALRASRPDLLPSLRGELDLQGARGGRLRAVFVVGQVALSLLLLAAAGLFLRTLHHAARLDPGFEVDGLHMTTLELGLLGGDPARERQVLRQARERVAALPEVESVALASRVPLGLGSSTTRVERPDAPPAAMTPGGRDGGLAVDFAVVDEGYFTTLRVPILRGRAFGEADREGAAPVAVVNETLARRLWPERDALGQRLRLGSGASGESLEVVGVARDGKYRRLWEEPRPHLYLAAAQNHRRRMVLVTRAAAGAGPAVAAAVAREVRAASADLPAERVLEVRDSIGVSLVPQRIAAAAASALGAVGALLAGVGLYGLVAFSVARRTREMGVRLALGARPGDLLRLVLRQGVGLALAGVGLGAAAAAALLRFLGSLLFGVHPLDPWNLAATALLLCAVAGLASFVPARRAARVDPLRALRAD